VVESGDVVTASETVGLATNLQDSSSAALGDTNRESVSAPEIHPKAAPAVDTSKDPGDDGGEMVFEGEDTVIY
jgi:hypothetical protein